MITDTKSFADVRPELHFRYEDIPGMYHAADDPDQTVVLYRGSQPGAHFDIIPSRAAVNLGIAATLENLESLHLGGEPRLDRVIDQHTSAHPHSPLVSTSPNPEMAQFYAGKNGVIYRIEVPAARVIIDAKDIGRSGNSGEALVAGGIFPDEIAAVKAPSRHLTADSELYLGNGWIADGFGALTHMSKSSNRVVKNPDHWQALR